MKKESSRGPLVAAVHRPGDLPGQYRRVVALVGRSNVGKSSLLNRLLGTTAARVSSTPGKTRGIYFYETAEGNHFADLPGAGFARVSREERAGWADLLDQFFRSGQVVLAVHLIDARVNDAAADLAIRDGLASIGVPALPVATKWDKLSARERVRVRRRLESVHGTVIPISAKTKEGIETLRREIRLRLKKGEEQAHG